MTLYDSLVFIIVDSLRHDYFLKCGLDQTLHPSCIYKCHVSYADTIESVPVLLTGKAKPRTHIVRNLQWRNRWTQIIHVLDLTLFDYFKDAGYHVHYINIDFDDDLLTGNRTSIFPNFPHGLTLNQFLAKHPQHFCLVLHFWTVHYPYAYPERFKEDMTRSSIETRLKALSRNELQDIYEKAVLHFRDNQLTPLLGMPEFKNALFVLTADHGEMLGEGNRYFHGGPLTPQLQNVPLAFHSPTLEHEMMDGWIQQEEVLPMILETFKIGASNGLRASI